MSAKNANEEINALMTIDTENGQKLKGAQYLLECHRRGPANRTVPNQDHHLP